MNACLHTQTQKPGKGEKHTQSFVSSNVGTYQTVPMEKEKEKQTDLKSVAKRKIVQESTERNEVASLLALAANVAHFSSGKCRNKT